MRMKKLAVMALATALSVGSVMTASAAWLQEGSNWRYQNDNGTFQTGTWFRDADGRWYHFDNNGIMQKGWFQDADGKWYFLAYNGVMQVGLIKVDNQAKSRQSMLLLAAVQSASVLLHKIQEVISESALPFDFVYSTEEKKIGFPRHHPPFRY